MFIRIAVDHCENFEKILSEIPNIGKNRPVKNLQNFCIDTPCISSYGSDTHRINSVLRRAFEKKTSANTSKTCWIFTGQGSQFSMMDQQLLSAPEGIKRVLEDMYSYVQEKHKINLQHIVAHDPTRLNQTQYSQPAIACLQMAWIDALNTMGVAPDFVLGHSIGEYAAAYAAGMLSKYRCIDIVINRALAMGNTHVDGGMIACRGNKNDIQRALGSRMQWVDIAAENSPKQTVISLQSQNEVEICQALRSAKILHKKIDVSHPFHSRWMQPAADAFARTLNDDKTDITAIQQDEDKQRPRMMSTSNKQMIDARTFCSADYLCKQILRPVYFSSCIKQIFEKKCNVILEIGPQPILSNVASQCLAEHQSHSLLTIQDRKGSWTHTIKNISSYENETNNIVNWTPLREKLVG